LNIIVAFLLLPPSLAVSPSLDPAQVVAGLFLAVIGKWQYNKRIAGPKKARIEKAKKEKEAAAAAAAPAAAPVVAAAAAAPAKAHH